MNTPDLDAICIACALVTNSTGFTTFEKKQPIHRARSVQVSSIGLSTKEA